MPDTMSVERRQVMAALGAQIILTPGAKGMPGAIARAEELVATDPAKYFMPGNSATPLTQRFTKKPRDQKFGMIPMVMWMYLLLAWVPAERFLVLVNT